MTVDGKDRWKAKIHTEDNVEVKNVVNLHCHESSAGALEAPAIKTSMKKKCEESQESSAHLL